MLRLPSARSPSLSVLVRPCAREAIHYEQDSHDFEVVRMVQMFSWSLKASDGRGRVPSLRAYLAGFLHDAQGPNLASVLRGGYSLVIMNGSESVIEERSAITYQQLVLVPDGSPPVLSRHPGYTRLQFHLQRFVLKAHLRQRSQRGELASSSSSV